MSIKVLPLIYYLSVVFVAYQKFVMHQMYCFLANFTELNIFVIAHFQASRYVKSLLALNNL